MSNCRFCCEGVDDRARRCPHCHADLSFFGRFRPIVTAVAAVGGLGFGAYEQWEAKNSKAETKQEQAAMATMLESVPEEHIPEKYKTDKSEAELAAEVKRNPKDVQKRISLHWLRNKNRNRNRSGQSKTNVANGPNKRTAFNSRRRSPRERDTTANTRQ